MIMAPKKSLLLLIQLWLVSPCLLAQLGSEWDAPGSYRKTDFYSLSLKGNDRAMSMRMLDAIVDVVKKNYPNPTGAVIGPYGGNFTNYRGDAEFKNGPYVYDLTIPFYELYASRNGGFEPSGEYTSAINIWINSVRFLLQANSVKWGNDRVFRRPVSGIPVGGFPKFNNMILIMPPGKSVPWRPATRQEYLENFIEALSASFAGRSVTDAERQQVPAARQLLASLSPSERSQIACLKKWKYSGEKKGYPDFGSSQWSGFLNPADTTGDPLVIVDESFYDKNIPRTTFQLIVIERQYPRATISAAAPTQAAIANAKRISDRLNNIVRTKELLAGFQQILGKPGWDYVASNKKAKTPEKAYVFKRAVVKNLDRIVDTIMRKYKWDAPTASAGGGRTSPDKPGPEVELPAANAPRLNLAARRLNTKAELVQYLDELDTNFSGIFAGLSVPSYNNISDAERASYGSWLFNHPRESLLIAIRASKKLPDNNSALNNLGATLSLCGADFLAIPLYIVCLKKEPANSTITNNLGQAYLALGDVKQAENYLRSAVGTSPYHPYANNSLGLIYAKQGNKDAAIKCFQNSLRGAFTTEGFHGLNKLKPDSAKKLINLIRHRYKQPEYVNFNKYPPPPQCIAYDQTEIRKAEHKSYNDMLYGLVRKYEALKRQQEPLSTQSIQKYMEDFKTKSIARPFLPFAAAAAWSAFFEFDEKLPRLKKELEELERRSVALKVEFDATMKQIDDSFEPRLEKIGEGNPDPTLDEEICNAHNGAINSFLPQFAEINEARYNKIVHVYKPFLNDWLYWWRFASYTEEQYRLMYYDAMLTMLRVLREVRLTTLNGYCQADPAGKDGVKELEITDPNCPLPIGVEIPFGVGKIQFDCKSWELEVGEGIVLNLGHIIGGSTTVAIGPGVSEFLTPKFGGTGPADVYTGIDAGIKGQLFITFDQTTVMDWGVLFEAEMDFKGLGKGLEVKQNVTLGVNKGLTTEGLFTREIDKYYKLPPPDKQVNKNVKLFPQ